MLLNYFQVEVPLAKSRGYNVQMPNYEESEKQKGRLDGVVKATQKDKF